MAQSRTGKSHIAAEAEAAEWVSAAQLPLLGSGGQEAGQTQAQAAGRFQVHTGAPPGTQLVFVASSAVAAESWELRRPLSALPITHTFLEG